MASVNVAELSDSELRKKIKELGKDAGPITKTTRPIWEKKLVKLLAEKDGVVQEEPKKERRKSKGRGAAAVSPAPKKTPSRSTAKGKKLAMFSSDEEPEQAILKSVQTSPIGFPSPTVITQRLEIKKTSSPVQNGKNYIAPSTTSSLITTRRKSSNIFNSNENRKTATVKSDVTSTMTSKNYGQQQQVSSLRSSKTKKLSEFSDDDFTDSGFKPKVYTYSHVLSSNRVPSDETDFRKPQEDLLFKRPGALPSSSINMRSSTKTELISSSKRSASPIDKALLNPLKDKKELIESQIQATLEKVRKSFKAKKPSPLIAGNLRTVSHTNKNDQDYDDGDDNDNNDEETEEEGHMEDEEIDVKFSPNFLSLWRFMSNKMLLLSLLLVLLIAIFLGLYYVGDKTDAKLGIAHSLDQDKNKANLDAAKCLFYHLSKKAGNVACGYESDAFVKISSLGLNLEDCFTGTTKESTIRFIKNNFKKEFQFSVDGASVASQIASKPLGCRISTALSVIAYRLLLVVAVVVFVIVAYFFIKCRWIADDEETRQMYYYVDKIIDTLKRHHALSVDNKEIPPYLPIPHVRDMLIPLASRKKMSKLWQKAVDFLNSSDSRVRMETQQIAGEDFEVWRWIDVCIPKMSKKQKKESKTQRHLQQLEPCKSWQGPAFDEIDGVVNMPIVPPTPCLKIRYLHEGSDEKEEGWESFVENAVIEKCQKAGGDLHHVFVDKTSKEGCVYVKCASIESAGKCFRAMYGNWFDGRLVIVKFVTLARYHQRFPEALSHVVPLNPSTEMESSLNWNKS